MDVLEWLGASGIPTEEVAHSPLSEVAAAPGNAGERSRGEEARLAEAASKLGVPAAYLVKTIQVESDRGEVHVHLPGPARVDPDSILAAAHAAWTRRAGDTEAPAPAGPVIASVWDESLLRFPWVFFAGPGVDRSTRVDTRHLRRAPIARAVFTASEAGTESAYDVLLERGFIDRVTDERLCRGLLAKREVAAYVGFDPTAESLHVGSLVPIMALAHLGRRGLAPIALVGGATALVGDPSGKTEMRRMLSREEIRVNGAAIRRQIEGYVVPASAGGSGGAAPGASVTLVDNSDWLLSLGYVDFLREVGVHFSVNRMLTAESFRARMEKEQGLSFLEFNYMCLQAYDFVHLARARNCLVQMGGSDQWGNIVAGIDLARRMNGKDLAGVTFPLLMTLAGRKFGKTEQGNVWLDAARTPPHEFFQFWRNTDDTDVERFLCLFTFLPVEQVSGLVAAGSARSLNDAKKVLAFEATRLAHGEEAAVRSLAAAEALFGDRSGELAEKLVDLGLLARAGLDALGGKGRAVAGIPVLEVGRAAVARGYPVVAALVEMGLASSKSEARRLVQQGAVTIGDDKVAAPDAVLPAEKLAEGELLVRVGKKKHGLVRLAG